MNHTPNLITCLDIKANSYEVPVDQLSFRPAVYAVVIKDGKILLSKQWEGYDLPGGGINLGEATEVALVREIKEETGLEATVGELLGCSNSFFKLPYKGNFVHSIHLFYQCFIDGGEISTNYFDEHEKLYAAPAEWIDLESIKSIKMYASINVIPIIQRCVDLQSR